jgi:hypothetical protein
MAAGAAICYTAPDLAAFGNRQGVRAMLESLPQFAEQLLPRITTAPPIGAGSPLVARDPSTLALAIVGIVTLAVYLAATGWRRPRRDEGHMSRLRIDIPDQPQPTKNSETSTRDAA